MKRWLLLIVSLALTGFVFSFSLASGEASGSLSLTLATAGKTALQWLFPGWEIQLESLHLVIRKSAHVFEYLLLGCSWTLTFRAFRWKPIWLLILALAIPLIDEGIQLFAVDRGPSLVDALVFDLPGFLLGIGIIKATTNLISKTKASN